MESDFNIWQCAYKIITFLFQRLRIIRLEKKLIANSIRMWLIKFDFAQTFAILLCIHMILAEQIDGVDDNEILWVTNNMYMFYFKNILEQLPFIMSIFEFWNAYTVQTNNLNTPAKNNIFRNILFIFKRIFDRKVTQLPFIWHWKIKNGWKRIPFLHLVEFQSKMFGRSGVVNV